MGKNERVVKTMV